VNNETERAIGAFNQALVADPHFVDATLALAELKIRKGDIGSAVALLKRLVQEQPKAVKAQLLLADAYSPSRGPGGRPPGVPPTGGTYATKPGDPIADGHGACSTGAKGRGQEGICEGRRKWRLITCRRWNNWWSWTWGEKEYSMAFNRAVSALFVLPCARKNLRLEHQGFRRLGIAPQLCLDSLKCRRILLLPQVQLHQLFPPPACNQAPLPAPSQMPSWPRPFAPVEQAPCPSAIGSPGFVA